MPSVKDVARKIPGLTRIYRALRQKQMKTRLKHAAPGQVFSDIFRGNTWKGSDSVSGPGSDLEQTRVLIRELPLLLRDLKVGAILDIPCGDFHWMSRVDLTGIFYLGADIVPPLIQADQARYGGDNVQFQTLDLIRDDLPRVDLVLCRDCLVHLSFDDIEAAFRNLCRSGSTWLLTTTFPDRSANRNILTGQWRPLNLTAPPFNLPEPQRLINEECTENGGIYRDKSLGLWKIQEIASYCL